MAYGPEMVVRSEVLGEIRLGCPPSEILDAAAPVTSAETRYMGESFADALRRGWWSFEAEVAGPQDMFWAAWREDAPVDGRALIGVMGVLQKDVRPAPHDIASYVFVREPYWRQGFSGVMRAARLLAAFDQGIVALRASVRDENEGSHKVVRQHGGVEIGHIEKDGQPHRTEFITVNPSRADDYWRQAIAAGVGTEEQRTSEAFQNGLSRTRVALDAARQVVTFLQRSQNAA